MSNLNVADEQLFLNVMNNALQEIETSLEENVTEEFPSIFILGLPRSGTTLLTQLIYSSLDVACTDHIVARFWKTPLVGAKLSKILFRGEKSSSFSSEYGRTHQLNEPHEFSWFWHKALNFRGDFSRYDPSAASKDIDWELVRAQLVGLTNVFQSGVVHKPLELLAFQLERFRNVLTKSLFIYIERDPIDTATSIYRAREANGVENWFSSYPPVKSYEMIKNGTPEAQVAGQVLALRKFYETQIQLIDDSALVRTTYEEVCCNPNLVLDKVVQKCEFLGGKISKISVPNSFSYSRDGSRTGLPERLEIEMQRLEQVLS